jgi:hypothetical protein
MDFWAEFRVEDGAIHGHGRAIIRLWTSISTTSKKKEVSFWNRLFGKAQEAGVKMQVGSLWTTHYRSYRGLFVRESLGEDCHRRVLRT